MRLFTAVLLTSRVPDYIAILAETEWRKNPTHQGGYLLDGGVHYIAGIRQLLGAESGNQIARISAFTNQLQDYLPPVDSADAVMRTKYGVTGTFQLSVGTSLRADEWTVACEDGWVKVEGSQVTVSRDGKETVKTVPNERTGVPPEVRAWGEALAAGTVRREQEPEAALADLELVSLQPCPAGQTYFGSLLLEITSPTDTVCPFRSNLS